MEKFGDYLTTGEQVFILIVIATMPIIAVVYMLTNTVDDVFIGYLGVWFTIVGGIATLHMRLRVYKNNSNR